ncbi:SdrD B-like domain-containing protein, partial [Tropicimonas sp.]|uniref:SdrD B-like domain-containing protein n=1 Tax=Tropicimonas sp. TaxID=2067044 RepID=UPI003A8A0F39
MFNIDMASPDGTKLTFEIAGGADAGLFMIDPETGLLSFVAEPDYESPKSADGDNSYDVVIRMLTEGGVSEEKSLTIKVLDTNDAAGQQATGAGTTGGGNGSISGRFFADGNDNAIDDGDAGVAGATVQLWQYVDNRWQAVRETTTDANGNYSFTGLQADTGNGYRVRFLNDTGREFAEANVGSNDAADSDASNVWLSGAVGETGRIVLAAGQQIANIDAALNTGAAEQVTISETATTGSFGYALGEELIVNGGFEEHPWASSEAGVWGLASHKLNGWTAIGTDGVELQKGDYNTGNARGNTIVELDRVDQFMNSANEGIEQTVTVTEAGTYRLSLDYYFRDHPYSSWLAKFAKATNAFDILVDGEVVRIAGADVDADFVKGLQKLSIDLELSAGTHTIGFVENDLGYDGGNDGSGASIDNVSLRQIHATFTDEELEQLSSRVLGNEIIVNGGFENHANAGKIGAFYYDSMQGWNRIEGASKIELQTGNYGTGNTVGNAIVELDHRGGNVDGIQQTISITKAGTYQLSFDYGMRAIDVNNEGPYYDSHSNAIKVLIDGEIVTLAGIGENATFDRGFQHQSVDIELSAGTHTIQFVEFPWAGNYGDDGAGAMVDNISLRQVGTVIDKGILSGTVYYDGDQDGRFDANEGGLGGRTVYLLNAAGQFVTDADGEAISRVTDAEGNYSFAGIAAGNYRVGLGDDDMKVSDLLAVKAGKVTTGADLDETGRTADTVIEICENQSFVRDFDTTCTIMSEDVYFMMANPVCARIGRSSFDENFSQSWNNGGSSAVHYYVFLKEPADADLTFTIRFVTDPSKIPYDGTLDLAPEGFAWFTNQVNEIDAPRFQEIEVTVKAGQTKSEAFNVGTESAGENYYFGMEVADVYNRDLNEKCLRVAQVVTTPIAFDLNRDGEIGVTGATTSANKAGLTVGETVLFDMNGDGVKERMEWFDGSGDGILVDNRDGKAATDMNGTRLFGDDNGSYANGYAKLLAKFDSNHDGKISGAELNGLALWVDDGDAEVDGGELQSLSRHSVTSISGAVSVETDALGREIIRSTVTQDFEASGNVTYRLEGPDAALFKVDAKGKVSFIAAPDYENPLDADGDNTYEVTLVRVTDDPTCKPARENLSIEICDKPSLGDTVWYDTNRDGIQNNGERGAADVVVKLISAATGIVVATTTTDANGNYLFDDIEPGNYKVMFVAPGGYEFTNKTSVGPEAANGDSDADIATGMTGLIHIDSGEHQRNVDAGLVGTDPGTASLGDYVWYDRNKDGYQNESDAFGAAGVTVKLIDADTGAVLATTTTDATGKYLFSNLDAGDYRVQFVAPNGYAFTTPTTFGPDETPYSSDANQTTGMTGTVHLSIGEAERWVDAGLVDPGTASLGDYVWYDRNKDGYQNESDAFGAAGVTVKLIDADTGAVLATTTTDATGKYLFSNLDAGDYRVQFVAPNGYAFTTPTTFGPDETPYSSDANQTTGMTGTVSLSIGEAERWVDAGLIDPGTASLGDTVWYDTDKDGVKDATEAGA